MRKRERNGVERVRQRERDGGREREKSGKSMRDGRRGKEEGGERDGGRE